MSVSSSTALIPYTKPMTPMEFINSQVERGLQNGIITSEHLPSSLSNQKIDHPASSLASIPLPSFAKIQEKVSSVTKFDSVTEEELFSLINQSQCKTVPEFIEWLTKHKPQVKISYSTVSSAFWKLFERAPEHMSSSLSNQKIEKLTLLPLSLASIQLPSFERAREKVSSVAKFDSVTEEELFSLIEQSQCKTPPEFIEWLTEHTPQIKISYSTVSGAYWKLSKGKAPEGIMRVKAPAKIIKRIPVKSVSPTEVIVAAGPGGRAWNRNLIEKMMSSLQQDKTITSCTLLGDGEQNLPIDNVISAIKKAKAKKLTISLFIQAHGEVIGHDHQLHFSDEGISSCTLFRAIRKELGDEYPLFIFMTACYGGAAGLIAAEELPRGATFVALSGRDTPVTGSAVEEFVNQMNSNPCWCNSEKMLYSYLMTLQTRYTPVITYAPNKPLDLEQVLANQLGESLSELQTIEVCRSLSDLMPKSEIMILIEKIKKSSSTIVFSADEWGKALAVGLSMSKVRDGSLA